VLDGDEYVINGSKTFISNGTHCDLLVIVAKTDSSQGAAGVSLIVAEVNDLPGFERGRVLEKVGQHGQDTRELFFSDMRVPARKLLGAQEGLGFYQLMQQLARERLAIASTCAGMAEAAVLEVIGYTKEREAFGRPLINFQHTKFELAELKAEVLSIKATVDYCIQQYINGHNDPATASIAKLIAADKGVAIVDRCVQFFGGYGYMMECPIARAYAAARVNKIYSGTSEIMKESSAVRCSARSGRHLVQESDNAGQPSVGADGCDVGADHERVIPVAAQAPAEPGNVVVGVDWAGQSEDVLWELALGRGDGGVDGVVPARVNQGVDVGGVVGPRFGDQLTAGG
jgi:alkylation response protein AidB-like acyl-CoA dehydrogenase